MPKNQNRPKMVKLGDSIGKAWSRRDSNPRPVKETSGLLHAYSLVGCQKKQGQRQPKLILSCN